MKILLMLLLLPFYAAADSHCKTSEWGPDDQIGAANRITEMSVIEAAKLVKTGKTYSLGLTIDANTPAFAPRSLSLTVVQPNQQEGARPFHNMTYNDDIFSGWLGIGSQIDGLGHLGENGVYYNCNHAKDFAAVGGLTKLGIENVPPIVTRGIVLDIAAHYGVDHLKAGQHFSVKDVKAVEKNQGTPIKEG
ncbi:MAG: cyclase family protein, partial [Gammaproteobacteria bacterium]|nr:cyclase family protein [Gammaproteobacteria bacterium]